jgi:hypothetical protein
MKLTAAQLAQFDHHGSLFLRGASSAPTQAPQAERLN